MATAKQRWELLDGKRTGVLQRARDAAALTIPSLLPPLGSNQNTQLPTPYQSLGARGVNNLASKLLLSLLPAGTPFFKMTVDRAVAKQLGTKQAAVDAALSDLENNIMRLVETSNLRVLLFSVLKHLIVTGNALMYIPKSGDARAWRLSSYVVLRDPSGNITEIVAKESAHPHTLSDEIKAIAKLEKTEDAATAIDIYTHIRLVEENRFEWSQQVNDVNIPGTEGHSDRDNLPFLALRWVAADNEDYGRGLVEEYIGDLISLEGLTKAVVSFSAAAAKIVLLLHPNSTTDEDALVQAESGDIVEGNLADIDVLQIDKFADFRVAKNVIDDLTLRLSHAFLLQSGTVRDAERVTAEEIRGQAQELEDVLGGVYTVLSQELQLPLVRRLIVRAQAQGMVPEFPKIKGKKAVEPVIVTGFDALGRSHELNKLRGFLSDALQVLGPQAARWFDEESILQALANGHNVAAQDYMKDAKTVAASDQAAQQQAMMSQLTDKAAGPIASEAAKHISPDNMVQ